MAGRLVVNEAVRIDDDGKIHLTGVKAIEEPPSLVDLRKRAAAMLPRVDLPEVILEVMSWEPGIAASASTGPTSCGWSCGVRKPGFGSLTCGSSRWAMQRSGTR